MSWLGGSLSSLTGQISNLTKDILTEGTEETNDPGAELRIAKDKIQDFQNVITALNTENERLKQLNHDLEEKAESSELQINTISQQYRQVLEEKQTEINKLKENQNELFQNSSVYTGYNGGYSPTNGTADDLDFGDSISMQHEINNLRKDNQRLKTINDRLKAASQTGTDSSTESKYQEEIKDLQRQLKDVLQQLSVEKENHQHEVVSLQDIHSQKSSVLRKKFKDEIFQYKQKISQLEDSLSEVESLSVSEDKKSASYVQLEEKLKSLQLEHSTIKQDYEFVCKELKHAKNQLLDQLDSNHAQSLEVLGDLREVRRQFSYEIIKRRDNLLEDKQYFIQQIIDSTHQQKVLKSEIEELEGEQENAIFETTSSDSFNEYEKENLVLKKKNLELQEQIVLLERSVQSIKTNNKDVTRSVDDELLNAIKADLEAEKEALEEVLLDLRQQLKERDVELGDFRDKLEKQECDNFALKKEKEDLEESLNESRLELSQKGTQGVESGMETLQNELIKKCQMYEELSNEKNEMEASLIELDTQHQEEMNQVISIRNDLASKLEKFRLNVQELTELKDQFTDQNDNQQKLIEELKNEISQSEGQIHNLKSQVNELTSKNEMLTGEIDRMKVENELNLQRVKTGIEENALKDLDETKQELELQISSNKVLVEKQDKMLKDFDCKREIISSLERGLQDKDEKIKNLEEKFHFVSEELQNTAETEASEYLQKIKGLNDSISEKESSINQLKSQCTDLEADKEKAEVFVTQLQKEGEVVRKQLTEMRDKFNNGAMTINNLHMDIQELKEKLSKAKSELDDKILKVCDLQEMNYQMKQNLNELKEENESLLLASIQDGKPQLADDIGKNELELMTKIQEVETLLEKNQILMNKEKDYLEYKKNTEEEVKELKDKLAQFDEEVNAYHEQLATQKIEFKDKYEVLQNKEKHLQETLDNKVKYYENLVETLQSNYKGNSSEENMHETSERDITIDSVKKEVKSDSCDEIKSVDLTASEQTIMDLQNDLVTLSNENEVSQAKIQEQKVHIDQMTFKEDELQRQVNTLLKKEKETLQNIKKLEQQIISSEKTIEDQKSGIIELNDKCQVHVQSLRDKESHMTKQEGIITVLHQASIEKEEQLNYLRKRMKRALSLIPKNQHSLLDLDSAPNFNIPALEYPEKGSLEQEEKLSNNVIMKERVVHQEMICTSSQQETEEDHSNVMEEMESLQSLIKDKDDVISELQTTNATLLKMLENKSLSTNDKAVVDINRLENEVRNLKIEREQIMAVMNEKSREASSLKSEVHRLMNVVAAEKSAIDKLQKDMVQGSGPEDKDDMQREALQNLSRLVRDKDLEVEALKQKNETLLAVLQDSSPDGSELGTLMQDKDNLTKQLKVLQEERDQMVVFVNQKHEESVQYHQEVQRLTQYINTELEKHGQIQQEYAKLAPQFEDKKQALLKAQNELINYKQKYIELEVKYGEMIQKVNSSDTVDITTYTSQGEELKHSQEKLKEANESLREVEQKITTLHQQNVEYEEELAKRDNEIHGMKKQIDILSFQLQGAQGQLVDLKQEHSQSEKESSEHVSHISMLKESNNKLTLQLHDRDFEIKSLLEKLQTLTSVVEGQRDEEGQVNKLLKENESLMSQIKELQQERHQTIMALKQRQIEIQELQRESQKHKDKELKYERELERLRGHLIQMEEAYTKDALDSEEREKDLRNRLAIAEEKVLSSSSAIQSASQKAIQEVESLQQQLHQVASQRDQAYLQLSALQDQVQQYSVSLSNLQVVLEQFQRDKDEQVSTEVDKYQRENSKLERNVQELEKELKTVQEKLEDAEDGLEAAARLHQQLDKCDQTISALREEVQLREAALKNAEVEISDLRNSKDSKVDKLVIKSMLLGYFTVPKNKQQDILHTIGSVLNFGPEEFEKVLGSHGRGGWMSGWLGLGGQQATLPTTPTRRHTVSSTDKPDKSFSELFVKFLETESSPKQTMKLPAEEMAKDVQRHHKPVFNPFTAPRHVDDRASREDQHLLMPSSPLTSTLPVFSPITDSSRTSSAILNDVLKSS